MTDYQMIKEIIKNLPEHDRARVEECAGQLRQLLAEGTEHAAIALALVGAEVSELTSLAGGQA